MSIRKKDGSLYKLRGPNKLMVTQKYWEDEVIVVHNFDQRETDTLDKPKRERPKMPEPEEPQILSPETAVSIDEFETESVVDTKPPEPEPEVDPNAPKSRFRSGERDEFYCLPAATESYVDDLYEEDIVKISYNKPFKFQAVVITGSDVSITIWTTVDLVHKMSVLFHSRNRRWWRVRDIANDASGDGLLMRCTVSDIEPDFSQS